MATPVTNNGVNVKAAVGGPAAPRQPTNVPERVTDNQGQQAFDRVNDTFANHPKHDETVEFARDAPPRNERQREVGERGGHREVDHDFEEAGDDDGNRTNRGHRRHEAPEIGEDGDAEKGNRGKGGDDRGDNNGRGPRRTGQTVETPPIIVNPNDDKGGDRRNGKTNNTPPIIVYPNDRGDDRGPERNGRFPDNRHDNRNNDRPLRFEITLNTNPRSNGNQTNVAVAKIVSQILRQNDIYLSNDAVRRLINSNTGELPRNVAALVRDVARQLAPLMSHGNGQDKLIAQVAKDIAAKLGDRVQTAARELLRGAPLEATRFGDLSAKAKLHVAAELMPPHFPEKAREALLARTSNDVVGGLLLARGIVEPVADPRQASNLVALKSAGLSHEIPLGALRDVGLLVKGLIAESMVAKTTANLDLAVGKFVKILLANNELGVLMATISLAAAAQNGSGVVGRTLALSQIYDLINQLIQSGEKASKLIETDSRSVALSGADREDAVQANAKTSDAAGHLRQYLEFNPAFMFDNSASAFNDPGDARDARREFVSQYQSDIDQWLQSGNHRLVREFAFDRPVGIVVERGSDDVFTANTARFVLVRDGSVQGWHFLKAFLVR